MEEPLAELAEPLAGGRISRWRKEAGERAASRPKSLEVGAKIREGEVMRR